MPGHAGFDISIYPGDAQMAWMKAHTNFVWCGFYLAPAPSHSNASWMTRRAPLVAQGWGIAPIFVGEQVTGPGSKNPSASKGTADANRTISLMGTAGFPAGHFVYLDLENGLPFPAKQRDYVAAWVDRIAAAGPFQPGVYCSHRLAPHVNALRPAARIWAFRVPTTAVHPIPGPPFANPTPSGCGFPPTFIWQFEQNGRATLTGAPTPTLVIDLDSSLTPNPGL